MTTLAEDPAGRRVVVLDVDSTFIQQEVIELLAAHADAAAEVAEVTAAAMRGELDFEQSLHARVATLAGLPLDVLAAVRAEMRLTPGARELVAACRACDWPVGLVSGGFVELIGPLALELGIGFVRANRLQVTDGRLTGRVVGPVIDRAAKAAALLELADSHGVDRSRTVAIGDGANDVDMLSVAGVGVAFNAKPALRAVADIVLDAPRLDAVLPMLGLSV